jgi:aminocarboxymuconate-semialdehyde decarboxylase
VPTIDIHTHFTPPEWIEAVRRDGAPFGSRVEQDAEGKLWLRFGDGPRQEQRADLSDVAGRLVAMDRMGLDRQALLPPMTVTGYELEPRHGQALARLYNDINAETARRSNGRLIAVATLPMQSSRECVEELDYAAKELGTRLVEIGTNVNGLNLDEEQFQPFWSRAAELGVLVLLHPHNVAAPDRLRRYYLSNLVGNPFDTTIAIASIALGGVLRRYPSLKLCFVHGGGAIPYLFGRVVHGWAATKAAHSVPESPLGSISSMYFDTLVHDPKILAYLYQVVGPEHLILGTDYPYDMGENDPLGQLREAGLADCEPILWRNAARLLDLEL